MVVFESTRSVILSRILPVVSMSPEGSSLEALDELASDRFDSIESMVAFPESTY